jgi:hypothetical protein
MMWLGFCQSALPAEPTCLTMVDYLGYSWKCNMKFGNGKDFTCVISGQWKHICLTRKFNEGDMVKFGMTKAANNTIVHILSPLMTVLRTMLPLSRVAGATGPVYKVEQYFWKN